jgi:Uma2 family endonuclease
MQVHVALPEHTTWRLDPADRLSDAQFVAFCQANPDVRVERTAEGDIVIVPPAGGESDYRSNKAAAQLDRWAEEHGRGIAFGSSVGFLLPDGSALSPDASWVSDDALARLTRAQRRDFLRLCPEFVIEVMSPSDRLKTAQKKMELWLANGAQLAWLIDGDHETMYVYRKGHSAKTRKGIKELAGEGPVAGFTLKLQRIWKGLS